MSNKIEQYDVIVVYSESIANDAMDKNYEENSPFSSNGEYEGYNDSYRYFLLMCEKNGINAAFATSKDIIGSGLFRSVWTYDGGWVRNCSASHSFVIFDKFSPENNNQKNKLNLLTNSESICMFNNVKIKDVFQNKLYTYNQFKEFAIPTVEILNSTKEKLLLAKTQLDDLLKKHNYQLDFNDGYLIKEKTGLGGFNIFKVNFDDEENSKFYDMDKKISYVIQPFINCNEGFVFGKHHGLIDLRVIVLNQKIIQTYIRIAKKGDFKCNEHQGGDLIYMSLDTIPEDVLAMSKKIIKKLDIKLNLKHSLYSLDFIRSNNGNLYFIEGNDRPGIDWNPNKNTNEIKSKELINIIVNELKLIISEKKLTESELLISN